VACILDGLDRYVVNKTNYVFMHNSPSRKDDLDTDFFFFSLLLNVDN